MDAGHTGFDQLLDLPGGKRHACVELGSLVGTGRLEALSERVGEPGLAEAGDAADLGVVGDRHHAWHDGRPDAAGRALVAKPEEVGVVVEELRHDHVAAGVALPLQVVEIGLRTHRLLVRLGIAGDDDAKLRELRPDE